MNSMEKAARYRAKHKERLRAQAVEYRAKNREQIRATQNAKYHANKDKYRTQRRNWASSNKDKILAGKRRQMGLPEPTRPCPLTCEVCDSPPGKKALSLDHCHSTNRFRGWLCGPCNLAIGLMKDSSLRLRILAAYLDRENARAVLDF